MANKGDIKIPKDKKKLYKNTLEKPTENSNSKYKQYRNKLNHVIIIAKKRYYNNRFEQAKENLKQTWNLINEIINKKKLKPQMPRTFHDNNNEISYPYTIAEKFNEYFTNVGLTLAKKNSKYNYIFQNISK